MAAVEAWRVRENPQELGDRVFIAEEIGAADFIVEKLLAGL